MTFFVVLAVATVAAWALPRRFGERTARVAARRGMAAALVIAGVMHFVRPESFLAYLPGWVPAPDLLNAASGAMEIAGGLALITGSERFRRLTGIALAVYLVAIFPANVYVAVAGITVPGLPSAWGYPWLRLPFQALFVWWVLWSTSPTKNPRQRSRLEGRFTPRSLVGQPPGG